MAITIENPNIESTMSLEEFIEFSKQTVKENDDDSLLACADQLKMLSNNSEFISDYINEQLKDLASFQSNNAYGIQSTLLHFNEIFYIRINTWPSISEHKDVSIWQKDLYHHVRAHDHNFSFITVGCHGKGYKTDIWEYDYNKVVGYVGEKVDLTFLEHTSLPKGKVMYYRASKDIHTQIPPEDYSISLNIMKRGNSFLKKEQYHFDLQNKVITGTAPGFGTGRYFLIDLARQVANPKTEELLEQLALTHETPHVRAKCHEALWSLNAQEDFLSKALNDNSKIVQRYAEHVFDAEEGSKISIL